MTPKHPVLLVDLSVLFRAAFHSNENGPTGITLQTTLDSVRRAVGLVPDCLVGVCCDGRGNWRKDLSPEYKAHREKQPESMYGQLDRVKAQLVADGFLLWTADGYEADDIIAGMTAAAVAAGHEVVVASHDKDLTQLIAPTVKMLVTSTWEFRGEAEVVAKFGVEPAAIGDFLALVGDKSDGVKGIPSVGPVTAKDLLIKHGDLEGIFRKVDALAVTDGKVETMTPAAKAIATPAIVEKLWKHKADALLARQLVTLKTDAPVKFDDIYKERKVTTKLSSKNVDFDNVDDVIAGPTKAAASSGDPAAASAPSSESASAPTATTAPESTVSAEDAKTTATDHPAPPPAASTALVPHIEVEYQKQFEPRSMGQALTLGEILYESRAYGRFPTAASITATVARGRELGIPALASLDAFHFVADLGRILPSWQLIRALAERDPKCKYFRWVEGDEKSATWETWHADHPAPTRMTYLIEQADKAGLIKPDKPKSAWMARPEEQLSKTCCCILARRVYSGAVLNLYAAEEMGVDDV